MKAIALWINGFLYQKGNQAVFGGIVMSRADGDGFTGEMHDQFGSATLTDIVVTRRRLVFTKTYVHRGDPPILYKFRRDGGCWIGNYSGPSVGMGKAVCMLTKIREGIFTLAG